MQKSLAVFLLFFSLSGCNMDILNKLVQTPEVKSIQLKSFSAFDKQAVFDVALYNPNAFAIPVSGISGNIQLNQLAIGSLEAASSESLPPLATQTVTVPLTLDTDALMTAAKNVLLKRQALYSFNGFAKTSVGSIPFTKTGELSVQDIISALLR